MFAPSTSNRLSFERRDLSVAQPRSCIIVEKITSSMSRGNEEGNWRERRMAK